MFFGPQKVLPHVQCASRDYSRKKVVLSTAVITTGAQATVLKTCDPSRMGKDRFGPASR